ncbi:MAG: amidohydrolase family protein, partial [Chloroflexi bacterium]|nr:amidohydrolase family protein [Chloroflexota bacterium]
AQPGFGGTSLIYPVLMSEGYHKRGLPLHRIAELVSALPARNFGLAPRKGTIAVGMDADLAVVDPELEGPVTNDRLLSAQGHTPFEGFPIKGWVSHTIRAGRLMYGDGKVLGTMDGQYLKRPVALHEGAIAGSTVRQ